jgi:putative ABC transport system permease protein
MRHVRVWLRRIAGMFGTRRRDFELAEEIASHLAMHVDDNIRRGMTPEEARRAAALRLGNSTSLQEEYRAQRGVPFVDHIGQDLRYAGRTLRRSPGFTVVAVLTIALGVAGPTISFTMLKAWVLEPLPFEDPDGLIDIRRLDTPTGNYGALNAADFLDFRRSARSLSALAGYSLSEVRLTGGDRAERVRGAQVTWDFFRILGVRPAFGRIFDERANQPGGSPVVIISHSMWRDYFIGDSHVVGRWIRINGEAHEIVGVLPETFQFTLLGRVHVWRPMVFTQESAMGRRDLSLLGLGRLRPGAPIEQARDELTRMASTLAASYPDTNGKRSVRVLPLAEEVRLHHDLGFIVPVLFAMVGCVLLIACVNVTNVMLARTSTRRQEMAVRLALGASRGRIVRQWLVEHVLLFVCASAFGAVLAMYGTAWITDSIPVENRQFLRHNAVLSVDGVVLFFALATGALCGLVFGLLPAWSGAQADVNADLRDGSSQTTINKSARRFRNALVIAEVSLALALLISAGLLVQTARNITRVDVGFDPTRLMTFQLILDPQKYTDDDAIRSFYDRLIADLRGDPGVSGVAAGSFVPFGNIGGYVEFFLGGQAARSGADTPWTGLNQITDGYAETLRLRLQRGRWLQRFDTAESRKVALINATLASRYFAGRDALGEQLRLGRDSQDRWTIVGVVHDVKHHETTDAPDPEVYVPFAQMPNRHMMVAVRASVEPETLIGSINAAVASVDPAEPVSRVFTMANLIDQITGPFETLSTFVAVLGAVTLLLAGIGVYGVVSCTFAQRTREIGIRIALGARRGDVAGLVLRQIRTFMTIAIVPGLVVAWTIGHAMRAMLVGVTPTDWRIYATMTLVLGCVAVIAAAIPVRRATSIDPVTALRYE